MHIRQKAEENELKILSIYATKSIESKGRDIEEEPCPVRMCFQRDRDRIIHSKAFRRLKHKTQVFFSPQNDHYRTRMTHTLEVSQIARTLSRALGLNEDLTEAIALGHDLGHTPFGHSGERVLNQLMKELGGFRHNEQSLRVVKYIEKLNLTKEVKDGILTHSWGLKPITLEGMVVQLADKIAYLNHDIEDAIESQIITENDLPDDCKKYFTTKRKNRLGKMINDVVENSIDKETVKMSEECWFYLNKLRNFMFEKVYLNSQAKEEENKVEGVVRQLFDYYCDFINKNINEKEEIIKRAVCDYIAGMTDRYAVSKYKDLFIPKSSQNKKSDEQIFKLIGIDGIYAR